MAPADSVAVHHSNNGLGHHADKALQVKHVQAGNVVFAHVAAVAAHLLVAARAEGLVFRLAVVIGARKDDHAHFLVVTRKRERVEQLDVRLRRERIAALGAVDGDLGDAIVLFVDDLVIVFDVFPREVAHRLSFLYRCGPASPRPGLLARCRTKTLVLRYRTASALPNARCAPCRTR